MVATLELNRQLHAGIVLTATGVSKCIEIEAYTVLTPLPLISQVGIGIAFDTPVVAEACGLGSLGLSEDIEIRVYGRGLSFSNPALPGLLEEVVTRAYISNGEISFSSITGLSSPLASMETIIASLEGSTIVIDKVPIPLHDLGELWGIIVKLNKPIDRYGIVEKILTEIGVYEKIILENMDDITNALYLFYRELYRRTGIKRLSHLIRYGEELGALGAFVDISGEYIAYLFEDYDTALDASLQLSSKGVVLESPLVVLGL